eukprot:GHVP01047783.1.p1 GENE.GHVP01047783.1~~GHVP01047783.1.p1  ORF type:complete len:103 (+),score=27.65 GHVP01047783.1:102-410(+)
MCNEFTKSQEKFFRELEELATDKIKLDQEVARIENKIYRLEKKYQDDVIENGGDILRSFDAYMGKKDETRKKIGVSFSETAEKKAIQDKKNREKNRKDKNNI